MTREEAIEILWRYDVNFEPHPPEEVMHAIDMAIEALSADRPKNMIHIDDVYRLIAGHSDYHGDSILSAFTCLVEGKDVKPIAPLDESADRPTGEWIDDDDTLICSKCHTAYTHPIFHNGWNYCPNCGARMF